MPMTNKELNYIIEVLSVKGREQSATLSKMADYINGMEKELHELKSGVLELPSAEVPPEAVVGPPVQVIPPELINDLNSVMAFLWGLLQAVHKEHNNTHGAVDFRGCQREVCRTAQKIMGTLCIQQEKLENPETNG